ncbi:MAG: branched-chain amino acid ABC transporter permease [Aigarchaeota archaeon]|nr:branched-chain amino acid ABC transporter permease [Candidatus Pelearchaeum maunauluense]
MKKSEIYLITALVLIIYSIYPLLTGDTYLLRVLILVHIFAILAASLDIIVGYTGQLTAGHTAVWGWGAFTTAWMILWFGANPLLAVLVGALFGALLGLGIGILCLRFRYLLLTLVTFALLVLSYALARQFTDITGGELGLHGITPITKNPILSFYITFGALLITVVSLLVLGRSRIGLRMKSIKEDEVAAETIGINTVRYKVLANVIGSFYAGLAGGLYTTYTTSVGASIFFLDHLLRLILMWGIGGGGTIIGPVIGAYTVMLLSEYLRFIEELRLILLGIIMILIMRFFPAGLHGMISLTLMKTPIRGGKVK